MISPSVSVILTAHNYGRFLDQSIRSVLHQTFQSFELIIVNDGSTDDTAYVAARYTDDPRARVLTLPGVGLAAACNHGIRQSGGKFILRLDADDFLDPHALTIEADLLDRNPGIGLVYPDYYTVDEQGEFLGYTRVPRVQDGACLLDANPPPGGAMIRRSCYDAIGGYNEALRYQEDFDFWLRFTERFQAYGAGLPLLSYRQHGGSMSRNRVPRAAARRYVKRQHATARELLSHEQILVVIPGIWPGAPNRPEGLLCRSIGDRTPIELALGQAMACEGLPGVVVVTDHAEARRAAESAGAEAILPHVLSPQGSDRPDFVWLRGLMQDWAASGHVLPTIVVLASPYCPLRHPERIREVVDTLLIHDCDVVVSTDGESITPWALGPQGLQALQPDAASTATRVVREAGELVAVRTRWLREDHPLAESLVGYVELLFPEWWCLKDEASVKTCPDLLPEADALKVSPSAFLRSNS